MAEVDAALRKRALEAAQTRLRPIGHDPLTVTMAVNTALDLIATGDECISCGEDGCPRNECPTSQRSCGHHCNRSWTNDTCHWCGKEVDEEGNW